MSGLIGFFQSVDGMGLVNALLPFLIIFIIFYSIVERIKFGSRGVRIGFSATISMMVIMPHILHLYPLCWDIVTIIQYNLSKISVILVAGILFLLLLGLFGMQSASSKIVGVAAIAIILYICYSFLFAGVEGWMMGDNYCRTPEVYLFPYLKWIIPIILIFLILWFITSDKGENQGGKPVHSLYQ